MDGRGDVEEDDNVVRLPRDWLGPPEQLVPMTPRGWARERERLAREAAAEAGDLDRDNPPTASDFWGAGASAVHGAIAADPAPSVPGGDPSPGEASPRPHRPRRSARRPPRRPRPTLPGLSVGVLAGRLPRPHLGLVAALTVVALAAVAAIGLR